MNDQQITQLLGLCSQWWPNWRAPDSVPVMVKSWRILLGDVDFDAGVAALSSYAIANNAFPPPVGLIRRHAAQLAMPGGQAPAIDEAWGEVLDRIGRVGLKVELPDGPTLTWSHPALRAVVEAMGWRNLCVSDNQVADRAHFARLYGERVERDVSQFAEAPNVITHREALAARSDAGGPQRLGDVLQRALPQRGDA